MSTAPSSASGRFGMTAMAIALTVFRRLSIRVAFCSTKYAAVILIEVCKPIAENYFGITLAPSDRWRAT
jgi:hypothetical protein